MNSVIMTWNVRGLGRPEKLRSVVNVFREHRAGILFIQESKLQILKPGVVRRLLEKKHGHQILPINWCCRWANFNLGKIDFHSGEYGGAGSRDNAQRVIRVT
ncbi:hypothetical protein HRI_002419600 [Hibiscus trionum]|uniref:Endonuclease/exonuclease/phosphatase domain-containing protein n=1 Tax=Hibiscus trionum TaxID=183268 RepID=A0A9W7I3K7_HIBTR|nr:hypothetical protein HRI_002419600 [Hibiscus trionum]